MRGFGARFAVVGGVLVLVLGAAGCGTGGGSGSGSSSGPIAVGVPAPLSGDYANAGQDIVNGAKLAAQKINFSGGVDGRKIHIIPQDDACQAQTAAEAAQKLLSQGIVVAAGGYCSTAAFPELEAFHRAGVGYVMDASTNPELTEKGYPEAFRTIGRDDEQGPFAAKFFTGFLHVHRIAILHDNTTYAKGLADNTKAAVTKDGGQVVYFDALTPGRSDYTSVLTSIAQSKPQLLYFTGYFAEFGLLLKEADELGLKFQIVGGDANNDPTVLKTAGAAADGAMITTAPLAQFLSSAKGYVSAYQKAYGHGPGPYSVYEYDAIGAVADAIKQAKSTDPKAIVKALAGIKSYHGVTGTFHFNQNGDRQPTNYITLRIEHQQFTAFKRYDLAKNAWVNVS